MKFNYGLPIAIIGLLAISLTSCGSESNVGTLSSASTTLQQSSAVSSSVSVTDSDATAGTPDTTVQSGKILALGDTRLSDFPSDITVGTQAELDRWKDAVNSEQITDIAVCNMSDSESELSAEQANLILKALRDADLTLYDKLGNPPTGGSFHVIAYNSSGAALFHSVYNGEWLSVAFTGEKTAYVFNGVGSSLDSLPDFLE